MGSSYKLCSEMAAFVKPAGEFEVSSLLHRLMRACQLKRAHKAADHLEVAMPSQLWDWWLIGQRLKKQTSLIFLSLRPPLIFLALWPSGGLPSSPRPGTAHRKAAGAGPRSTATTWHTLGLGELYLVGADILYTR